MRIDELISAQHRRKAISQMHRAGAVYDLINLEYGVGFVPMKDAHGAYSSILVHPKLPYIIKLFDSTDTGYLEFLKIAVAHPDNPHFPKLRGRPMKLGEKFVAVRMEKLLPFGIAAFEEIEYMLDTSSHNADWQKHIDPRGIQGEFLAKWPRFAEALDILRNAEKADGIRTDWHNGNIMKRDNGTPVILDPFAPLVNKPVVIG